MGLDAASGASTWKCEEYGAEARPGPEEPPGSPANTAPGRQGSGPFPGLTRERHPYTTGILGPWAFPGPLAPLQPVYRL